MTHYEDKDVEEFYGHLDNIIAKTPKKGVIIVQGDWYTKPGPKAYEHWAGTVGMFGQGGPKTEALGYWNVYTVTDLLWQTLSICTENPEQQCGMVQTA